MRLNIQTDYALRFLTYAALVAPQPVSVTDAAARFRVSSHHLMKVAKSLTREGFLVSTRGRSGGFRLSRSPGEIVVGDVVRKIEREIGLVECMRIKESACPIVPACRLPMLLNEATMAFLAVLDSRTLADLTAKNAALLPLLERAS